MRIEERLRREGKLPPISAVKPSWNLEAEKVLMADACKRDLWLFVKYAWGVSRNPRGIWLDERVHRPLCRWLQVMGLRWLKHRKYMRDARLMVIWPRDTGKSVIVTKAFQAWLHLWDNDLATAMGSASAERSYAFLRAIRTTLEARDPYASFTKYYGQWWDPTRLWREDLAVHAKRISMSVSEPSFGTFSVETGATSYHPDAMFFDDPITKELMETDSNWLKKVNDSLVNLIPVVKRGGLFVYVGTPYHDADAIHTLLREEGYGKIYGMPMTMNDIRPGGPWQVYYMQGRDASRQPMFPKSWPEEKMLRYEQRSPSDFAAQIMCQPTEGEHMPITRDQIEECYISAKDVPRNCSVTIHLDTAFKTPARMGRGDDNVIIVAKHPRNGSGDVYYVECQGSNRWRAEDFLEQLANIVRKYQKDHFHIRAITDEVTEGGKTGLWENEIRNYLRNLHLSCPPIHMLGRGGRKKEIRIREAAGYWIDGHVFVVRGAPGIERLIGQMLAIGQSAHDDYADAAADAFHEKVYYPMTATDQDSRWTTPKRPYDDLLQDGFWEDADERPRAREPIS